MTSLTSELGREVTPEEALPHLARNFGRALGCQVVDRPPPDAEEIMREAKEQSDGDGGDQDGRER